MVYAIDTNIQHARAHLNSGDDDRLIYACLELRFALEHIAYQKLQLRLKKLSYSELRSWQPRRVLDRLMELVDDNLTQDFTLSVGGEHVEGKAPEDHDYTVVGTVKGVNPRDIGKHWQKLSSFLHLRLPKENGDRPFREPTVPSRSYLEYVIDYVDNITNTQFDAYMSFDVTFACTKCDQSIVRNRKRLKQDDIVKCQNPDCDASYIAHKQGDDEFSFERYYLPLECKACNTACYADAEQLLKMSRLEACSYVCDDCGAKHIVCWRLQYALKEPGE